MQKLNLIKKYEVYPEYINSGVDWLGKIPNEWRTGKVKEVFNLLKQRSFNNSESEVLSLTLNGIKTRDVSNNEGQIAASYEGYRKIIKGDIVLNPMDLIRGFVDSSKYEGIISPAYSTLRKKDSKINSQFYNYFFQKHYFEEIFHPFGNGVSVDHRWTLKDDTLVNFPVVIIPFEQQTKIAKYLDEKTAMIEEIIKKKTKLIELLKEKRAVVINNTVTKGLDKNVTMIDSGIDWIGKIPKNWELKKIKYLTKIIPSNVDKLTIENEEIVHLCNYVDVYKNEKITNSIIENFMIASAPPKQIKKLTLKKDDVIITKDSETPNDIGIPAYVPETLAGVVCGYHLAIIRPHHINGEYLFRCFQSNSTKVQFFMSANGLTRYAIGIGDIGNLVIVVPPIEEQNSIQDKLEKQIALNDLAVERVQFSIKKLMEFKFSLISNVVTGKIKV